MHGDVKLSPWFIVLMLANAFAIGATALQRAYQPVPVEIPESGVVITESPCARDTRYLLRDTTTGQVANACAEQ